MFIHHCIVYFHTSSWIQGLEDMFIFYFIVSNISTPAAGSRDWRTYSFSTILYRIFSHQQLDPGIGGHVYFLLYCIEYFHTSSWIQGLEDIFIFYYIVSNIFTPAAGSRDWRTCLFSTLLYRIFPHQQLDPGIGGHVYFLLYCIEYFHTSSWIQGLEDMFIFYFIVSNISTPAAGSRDWRTCLFSTLLYRIFSHQQLNPGIGGHVQFLHHCIEYFHTSSWIQGLASEINSMFLFFPWATKVRLPSAIIVIRFIMW